MAVVVLLLALVLASCSFEGSACERVRARIPAAPACGACVCQPCACPGAPVP